MIMPLSKRQEDIFFTDDGRRVYVCDSSCQKANIAKWAVFLGIFTLIFLWLTVGYVHARRRIRKGQPPMMYHRWLAPKQYRQNNAGYYNQQPGQAPSNGYYGMQAYPEPPPMYNPAGMPPAYMPPPGATKADPQQNGAAPPAPTPPAQSQGAPQLPPVTQ